MALYFERRINKKALLQIVFLAIIPTVLTLYHLFYYLFS